MKNEKKLMKIVLIFSILLSLPACSQNIKTNDVVETNSDTSTVQNKNEETVDDNKQDEVAVVTSEKDTKDDKQTNTSNTVTSIDNTLSSNTTNNNSSNNKNDNCKWESVLVKEAWTEEVEKSVLVKDAWTEYVLVKEAWTEEKQECAALGQDSREIAVCNTCGHVSYSGSEANTHGSDTGHGSWHTDIEYYGDVHCLLYETTYIDHPAEYQAVYHEAQYETVTETVYHEAEYESVCD